MSDWADSRLEAADNRMTRLANLSRDVFSCLRGLDEDIDNVQTSMLLPSFLVLYLAMMLRILSLRSEEGFASKTCLHNQSVCMNNVIEY